MSGYIKSASFIGLLFQSPPIMNHPSDVDFASAIASDNVSSIRFDSALVSLGGK